MSAEPTPGCSRQHEAGSYLLGALNPTERADYARHLETCQLCLHEVGQLAGLPGLLARGPAVSTIGLVPAQAGAPAIEPRTGPEPGTGPEEPDPVTGALRELARLRRRSRMLVAAGFVLVVGLGLVGSTVLGTPARATTGVTAAAELPVRMQPVGNAQVSAAVALTTRPWGTEVVMRCRYAGTARSPVYILVAKSADGATTELGRWSAVADQDIVLAAATDLSGPRLAELEVRNAAGTVLLRAEQPS